MQSQRLLHEHPSVQDLTLGPGELNQRKYLLYKQRISSDPLMSAETRSAMNAKKVPKGQSVEVVRNEENLRKAGEALMLERSRAKAPLTVPAKNNNNTRTKLPSIHHSAPHVGSATPTSSSSVNDQADKKFKQNVQNIRAVREKALTGGRAGSVVSTVFSYEGDTDDGTASLYSCSCCHVERASTVSASTSAYENMTSVSQRAPNSSAGTSTCSTRSSTGAASRGRHHSKTSRVSGSSKLVKIEEELAKEREDRERTAKELEEIRKRQQLLLNKLSDSERAALANA